MSGLGLSPNSYSRRDQNKRLACRCKEGLLGACLVRSAHRRIDGGRTSLTACNCIMRIELCANKFVPFRPESSSIPSCPLSVSAGQSDCALPPFGAKTVLSMLYDTIGRKMQAGENRRCAYRYVSVLKEYLLQVFGNGMNTLPAATATQDSVQ